MPSDASSTAVEGEIVTQRMNTIPTDAISPSASEGRSESSRIMTDATFHVLPSVPIGLTDTEQDTIRRFMEATMFRKERAKERKDVPHRETDTTLAAVTQLAITAGFEAAQALVVDDFNEVFADRPPKAWSWNMYLMPLWLLGVVIRSIMWPFRVLTFVLSALVFVPLFMAVNLLPVDTKTKHRIQRRMIHFEARIIMLTWFAVIQYHGVIPARRPNQIYVCNHTSLIDFVFLEALMPFATVGQKQGGWIGFIQNRILACMEPLWFDRLVAKQRALLTTQLKKRVSDDTKIPILVFPEGVCTNNTSTVQFKRGSFDVPDVEICPITIKYNNLFSDAYWRDETFWNYCCRIWHSWCVVADIWFLPPQHKLDGESAEAFAARVQKLISDKAGLKFTTHNGYLKYFSPSRRFVEVRQKVLGDVLAEYVGDSD
ncbi:Acyltransferase [Carpediemonas membranifera]|uniref:Acyltransferase n=1 Tax=Carpediemonas membranifera TaxID=201153 RepID=A0A8J6DX95_9EUKA|nr:Acyltransferase [Carpediemonas membranifera]|eukprot:KAG9389709.1 Acyltransferase [Carpediemonas membranifera]